MQNSYDFIIVGSGFGGSVSALRLAQKGYRVAVIEQGRRWKPSDYPKNTWDLGRWIWDSTLGLRGFFSIRVFQHVMVMHGNAVGGGSIAYANVLMAPPDKVWKEGTWAGLADWEQVMPAHFAEAKRMLGVATNRFVAPADLRLLEMAKSGQAEQTFAPAEVGVFFGPEGSPPGVKYPDPYFEGEGPERSSCIGCGACLIGCRHGAKNTLDMNYLYLAEKAGVDVMAETKVVGVAPVDGIADGSQGYVVETRSTARGEGRKKQRCVSKGIVFAASSLGTQDLLLRLKEESLPNLSSALGERVLTNAESIIGVRYPGSTIDLSQGIAIGSKICLDERTNIQAGRYPAGSNIMGLLMTIMAVGGTGLGRQFRWAARLFAALLRHPVKTLRALSVKDWARESVMLLCMQAIDVHVRMRLRRRWYWPFSRQLATEGARIPAYIPLASDFAIKAAKATGGVAIATLPEILLRIPTTGHCMGGAAMGHNPGEAVCDGNNRVFGYHNMYICDGSVVAANLGVNPSLTIAALTEHAMSHVPDIREQRWENVGEICTS